MEKRSSDKKPRAGGARPTVRPAPAAAPASEEPRDGAVGAGTEELDQVVTMLGDMDIEVEAVEETALAEESAEKTAAEPDWTEEPAEAEEVERAPGETADPVRMYLQEMGGVPLLTREEEVAIAKEIETGEREVREAVFSLDLAVESVLVLGDRLKRGEIEARHVFGDDDATSEGSDAAESGPKEDKRADGFLKQVGKLRRVVGEGEKLRAEQQRARTSKVRKAAIGRRLEIITQTVREVLLETKIGAKHIVALVERLKDAHGIVDREQLQVRRLEQRLGHSSAEVVRYAGRIRADEKDARQMASRLFHAPAATVVEAGETIKEARRRIKQATEDIGGCRRKRCARSSWSSAGARPRPRRASAG